MKELLMYLKVVFGFCFAFFFVVGVPALIIKYCNSGVLNNIICIIVFCLWVCGLFACVIHEDKSGIDYFL
jgi:hypothetical protein